MKEDFLKGLGLEQEAIEKIMAESRKETEKAKADSEAVSAELEKANSTIKTLQDTVKKFDGVDIEKLKGDIEGWKTKYNSDIADIKRNSAVEMAIAQAKGRNSKAIKALIDMEKISVKDDGTVEGLDIEKLKESAPYLFDIEVKTTEGTGFTEGSRASNLDNVNNEIAKSMGVI